MAEQKNSNCMIYPHSRPTLVNLCNEYLHNMLYIWHCDDRQSGEHRNSTIASAEPP